MYKYDKSITLVSVAYFLIVFSHNCQQRLVQPYRPELACTSRLQPGETSNVGLQASKLPPTELARRRITNHVSKTQATASSDQASDSPADGLTLIEGA